ncbi:uncharacterized protein LOC114290034 [Camellia sinensis]|uniref:uncharacterized protein LOC114290034 n=1 Tax=Camellia sinensis TaxID=4442 RepID=UPI00103594F9|nr:uncharacterized protein LOC114290034 [Camellia sinensis]
MVIELLEGIHFVSFVEAISLGAQAGIHPWIIYDIISNATGNSWVFKNHVPQLLRDNQTKHLLNTFVQNLFADLLFFWCCCDVAAVAEMLSCAGFSI